MSMWLPAAEGMEKAKVFLLPLPLLLAWVRLWSLRGAVGGGPTLSGPTLVDGFAGCELGGFLPGS